MAITREFPGLSDTMQGAALEARSLGLSLVGFNSGAGPLRNSCDGFRIFRGFGTPDYFRGDHLIQLATKDEVLAWLNGYKTAAAFKPVPDRDQALRKA
jgi:hypothetical protein